jgi:hypothetical protein
MAIWLSETTRCRCADGIFSISDSPGHTQQVFAPAKLHVKLTTFKGSTVGVQIDGENYYRSSSFARTKADGEQETFEFDYRDVPGGDYELTAAVGDSQGKILDHTSRTVHVISQFGGQ